MGAVVLITLILAIVTMDGCVKAYIDQRKERVRHRRGRVSIKPYRNTGAVYSIGKEHADKVQKLSMVMLGILSLRWLWVMCRPEYKGKRFGYSLLFGGSISNVMDRIRKKYVVDYLHVDVKFLRKIIFNLSDICIFFGGIIVTISELCDIMKKNEIKK